MAQLVERVLGKDEVTGSNPVSSSIKKERKVLALRSFFMECISDLPRTNKRAPKNNFARQKNFREEEQDD